MDLLCDECDTPISNRKPRYKNTSKKYNFCSPKCKYRFYRRLEFASDVTDHNRENIMTREQALVDIPTIDILTVRQSHLNHKIRPRRFTIVAFYCDVCKKFTHRTLMRETLTRQQIRWLQYDIQYREKRVGRYRPEKESIPYDPKVVSDEMELREREEYVDDES